MENEKKELKTRATFSVYVSTIQKFKKKCDAEDKTMSKVIEKMMKKFNDGN